MKRIFLIIAAPLLLQNCSNEASHMPPILALPGLAIGNAIENSVYNARRSKVKNYVVTNYDVLRTQVKKGDGAHLEALLTLVGVDEEKAAHTKAQWQKDYEIMFMNRQIITEDIMRTYARIYVATSSAKTKTLNGLSYTDASSRIDNYLRLNVERFRIAIKQGDKMSLKPLLDTLLIDEEKDKTIFFRDIMMRYDVYFIEPVVVAAMVAH